MKLGENFLFPKRVVSGNEETVQPKEKYFWRNRMLNEYQKDAVRNILNGTARPLPYVIFGPPGTGKTITVCESVLQIFFKKNVKESRILIATPSNSSANLIAERLLDTTLINQGELVNEN